MLGRNRASRKQLEDEEELPLMLTRVSQQQTKCPIRVQILKVLLCHFHGEYILVKGIVPGRTFPSYFPVKAKCDKTAPKVEVN